MIRAWLSRSTGQCSLFPDYYCEAISHLVVNILDGQDLPSAMTAESHEVLRFPGGIMPMIVDLGWIWMFVPVDDLGLVGRECRGGELGR